MTTFFDFEYDIKDRVELRDETGVVRIYMKDCESQKCDDLLIFGVRTERVYRWNMRMTCDVEAYFVIYKGIEYATTGLLSLNLRDFKIFAGEFDNEFE